MLSRREVLKLGGVATLSSLIHGCAPHEEAMREEEAVREGTVVLLSDMQERFLKREQLEFRIEDTPEFQKRYGFAGEEKQREWAQNAKDARYVLSGQVAALKEYREQGVPVILVEYGYRNGEEATPAEDTYPELLQALRGYEKSWILTKTDDDAFDGTGLHSYLKKLNVGEVILFGLDYPACVEKSAATARRLGYKAWVRHELTLSLDAQRVKY